MPVAHDAYSDELLRAILTRTKTVAVVGASANPERPSFGVLQFLRRSGYTVYAVHPGLAPDAIAGVESFASLAAIPVPIDMVDVFRNSAAVSEVVGEALALTPLPGTIWMQLGVRNDEAAALAQARGIQVVMDRCPAIERPRLFGRSLISGPAPQNPAGR